MAEDNVQALVAELSLNSKRIERQQNRLLKKFDTTFNSIEKTGRKRLANVERRAEEMSRNVRRAIAAIALGIAGREVTSYADAWTDLNNKVKAAGEVSGIQGRAMKELAANARATCSSLKAMRSSAEPPPLPTMTTSARPSATILRSAEQISRGACRPCTRHGASRMGTGCCSGPF